jgi:putative membrane protein
MIVRPRPNALQLFFILRGSIVPDIIGQIAVAAICAALVVFAHRQWPNVLPVFEGAPFAVVGIALSIFLGFRNNACYDRWWEARKQWGEHIFLARNFVRQSLVLEAADGATRRRLNRLVIAFTWALARHLRPAAESRSGPQEWLGDEETKFVTQASNRPDAILRLIGMELARLRTAGALSDVVFQTLDTTIGRMGLCKRRANGFPTHRCLSPIRFFCIGRPMSFASSCPSGSPARLAGRRRLLLCWSPIRSSGSMR